METITYNVPSITCSVCSNKIQNGVSTLNGVNNVSVDLKSKSVKVDYNPSQVTPPDIKKQISNLGYEVN